jgi:hypothetical protein
VAALVPSVGSNTSLRLGKVLCGASHKAILAIADSLRTIHDWGSNQMADTTIQ